jgi:hypothetical protein
LLASSQHNLYDIAVCTVLDSWWWTENLSENKFEKLVYLVGFIIRIYHYARSSECKIPFSSVRFEDGANASYLAMLRQGFPDRIIRMICKFNLFLLYTV